MAENVETVHKLDDESLRVFEQKGTQDDRALPQTGNANAVKVRRVVQIIKDLSSRPISELRVLDLACGEGVYSIELALRGADVQALDARTERMAAGIDVARRSGLANLSFQQADVRHVEQSNFGDFDVILFLGILYHLDVPDSLFVLKNLHQMCRKLLIIDTHISLAGRDSFPFEGKSYAGTKRREHRDTDSPSERQQKLLMSVDNVFNFWFTRESLVQLLTDIGFSSVFECVAPLEAHKPRNRLTLVAVKGEPVRISTYPWINDLTEQELNERLRPKQYRGGVKRRLQQYSNALLRPLGLELRRTSN
ncbi:MAG: class I SAM-dependent methyltransferase [Planctomycetes bacterium]|nr:class I SAM-dependent methyltransferase [Planctomycetota bacterium]